MTKIDKNHRHGEAPLAKLTEPNIFPVDWTVYELVPIGTVNARLFYDARTEACRRFQREPDALVLRAAIKESPSGAQTPGGALPTIATPGARNAPEDISIAAPFVIVKESSRRILGKNAINRAVIVSYLPKVPPK